MLLLIVLLQISDTPEYFDLACLDLVYSFFYGSNSCGTLWQIGYLFVYCECTILDVEKLNSLCSLHFDIQNLIDDDIFCGVVNVDILLDYII